MNEKQFFTKRRNDLISQHPELINAEQWGKFCYVPLDIPKFEFPEIVDWFSQNSKPTVKVSPDIATDYVGGKSTFDAVDIIPSGDIEQDDIWTLNIRQDFLNLFPNFYDMVMTYFPFKEIHRIRLWESKENVIYHRDHTKFLDCPGAFRIMLHDTNPVPTLSLIDSTPDSANDFSTLFRLPRVNETNCFAWNNLRTKHGSMYHPNYKKIVVILDRWEIDIDRYVDLMNRSVDKYHKYAMISNRPIQDYVNA